MPQLVQTNTTGMERVHLNGLYILRTTSAKVWLGKSGQFMDVSVPSVPVFGVRIFLVGWVGELAYDALSLMEVMRVGEYDGFQIQELDPPTNHATAATKQIWARAFVNASGVPAVTLYARTGRYVLRSLLGSTSAGSASLHIGVQRNVVGFLGGQTEHLGGGSASLIRYADGLSVGQIPAGLQMGSIATNVYDFLGPVAGADRTSKRVWGSLVYGEYEMVGSPIIVEPGTAVTLTTTTTNTQLFASFELDELVGAL